MGCQVLAGRRVQPPRSVPPRGRGAVCTEQDLPLDSTYQNLLPRIHIKLRRNVGSPRVMLTLILRSISFAMDQHAYPYLARQLSIKDARQSTEGDPHDGRLIDRGARDQELDGNRDTRHKIYTGSGHRCDVKPYVMCSVGLY